jgi:hypothetical protein
VFDYISWHYTIGTVRERVGNGRQYIIEWADQTVQLQVLVGIQYDCDLKKDQTSTSGLNIVA